MLRAAPTPTGQAYPAGRGILSEGGCTSQVITLAGSAADWVESWILSMYRLQFATACTTIGGIQDLYGPRSQIEGRAILHLATQCKVDQGIDRSDAIVASG